MIQDSEYFENLQQGRLNENAASTSNAHPEQPTAQMNAEQVDELYREAEAKITAALTEFARQLPCGQTHLQNALNSMGETLGALLIATGQQPATSQPDIIPNPDLAPHREEMAGVLETEDIREGDMS